MLIIRVDIQPTIDNEELRAKIKSLQYEVDNVKQERDYAALQHDKALREATSIIEAKYRTLQVWTLQSHGISSRADGAKDLVG